MATDLWVTNSLLLVIDGVKSVTESGYEIDHSAPPNELIAIDYLGYFKKQIDRSCQTHLRLLISHVAFVTLLLTLIEYFFRVA